MASYHMGNEERRYADGRFFYYFLYSSEVISSKYKKLMRHQVKETKNTTQNSRSDQKKLKKHAVYRKTQA